MGKSERRAGIDNVPLTHFFDSTYIFLPFFLSLQVFTTITSFPALTVQSLYEQKLYLNIMPLTESTAVDAAQSASLASRRLATLNNDDRNKALTLLHDALEMNEKEILEANARDVESATIAAESGNLSHSVLKRLDLSRPGKYKDMLDGILSVRDLDDPSECNY